MRGREKEEEGWLLSGAPPGRCVSMKNRLLVSHCCPRFAVAEISHVVQWRVAVTPGSRNDLILRGFPFNSLSRPLVTLWR